MSPPISLPDLRTLRQKYNVAWSVHEEWVRAITAVRLRGEQPPVDLVNKENHARQALEYAREQLRIGITESITGHHPMLSELFAAETAPEPASDVPKR